MIQGLRFWQEWHRSTLCLSQLSRPWFSSWTEHGFFTGQSTFMFGSCLTPHSSGIPIFIPLGSIPRLLMFHFPPHLWFIVCAPTGSPINFCFCVRDLSDTQVMSRLVRKASILPCPSLFPWFALIYLSCRRLSCQPACGADFQNGAIFPLRFYHIKI